jgi:DNA-binding transcriptional ArsR family regulator
MWKRFGNSVLSADDSKYAKVNHLITKQLLEFKEIIRSKSESEQRKPDRETRKLLFYLFTSTRGGFTRLRIIMMLLENPLNTNQLSKDLNLDYKAVQHHMKVLEKNNMVSKIGEKYGAEYHLSNFLEINMGALDSAIDKLDRKLNHKKVYL